jgi:predicted solute-binding protein
VICEKPEGKVATHRTLLTFHQSLFTLKAARLGCVKYLNARPLIHGWPDFVTLDHPATLCQQLARGDLDVALVSSFEFLRNPIYRIADKLSISSNGAVYSVVLAHCGEISDIDEIVLDPAAETSTNLLSCLLAESGLRPRLISGPASTIGPHRARLLIGDQAIRFRLEHENQFQFWDLGEQWKRLLDLPFVYALWLIRPEVVDPKSIANRLRALRDENLAHLDRLIATEKGFESGFLARYYREHLRFSLGGREKEGLRAFANLCGRHDLLPKREITFDLV